MPVELRYPVVIRICSGRTDASGVDMVVEALGMDRSNGQQSVTEHTDTQMLSLALRQPPVGE